MTHRFLLFIYKICVSSVPRMGRGRQDPMSYVKPRFDDPCCERRTSTTTKFHQCPEKISVTLCFFENESEDPSVRSMNSLTLTLLASGTGRDRFYHR